MKKLITIAVVVAIALTSTVVSAQSVSAAATKVSDETLSLKIEEVKPLQFRLAVENPAHEKLNIVLTDEFKNVLFEDFAGNDAKYGKTFNLENLFDGTFTFSVSGRKGKVSKSFEIQTKTNRVVVAKAEK